jgi:hypothetical protein
LTGPDRGSLPLRDYDHLPAGALTQRIRSLSADELVVLLQYESAHANRPAVIQAMRARLNELDEGAEPSGGSEQSGPDWPEGSAPPPPARPETTGPPSFPPPHGEPAQPARPKANRQVS